MSDTVDVHAGQVYELPDGREIFVMTDPAFGTVRGRWILSVDTVTDRINRSGIARFAKLKLNAENCCFRCWMTGSNEGHEPKPWATEYHEDLRARRERLHAEWDEKRAARKAAAGETLAAEGNADR